MQLDIPRAFGEIYNPINGLVSYRLCGVETGCQHTPLYLVRTIIVSTSVRSHREHQI